MSELTADELIDALGELRERAERSDVLKEKLDLAEEARDGLQSALSEANQEIAELEDKLDSVHSDIPKAVFEHVRRLHEAGRHPGLVRFCLRPECDGWDVVLKEFDIPWPPS